jgi:RHS repeat-associated protein
VSITTSERRILLSCAQVSGEELLLDKGRLRNEVAPRRAAICRGEAVPLQRSCPSAAKLPLCGVAAPPRRSRMALAWVYTLVGADGRQLATYNGLQGAMCGRNGVRLWPVEFNTYGPNNTRIITRADGTSEVVISDYLGSARVTLSTTAEPLQSSSYHPYGTERTSTGSGARTSYIGREHDKETDLGFYGVRLYEPEYGRFLSTDVLWSKYLPLQPFQYAGNNPISLLDRNGKDFQSFMKFYQVASRHLGAIQQMASSTSLEHGGWLVSNKGSDWVAWTGPFVSGGEYTLNRGTNHEEYLSRNGGNAPNPRNGETLIAGVHTHPSENSFSDQDVNTFLGESLLRMNNGQESVVAKFNVVVTKEHVYGMEILDAKKLNEFVGNDDNKIRSTWTKLFQSAKGSIAERTMAANQGLSKATGGAIGFYIVDRSTGDGKEAK